MYRFGVMALATMLLAGSAVWAAQPPDSGLEAMLRRLNIVKEDDRQMVEVRLRDLLELALDRSLTLKRARMGEDIAQLELNGARGARNPVLTNKAGSTHTSTPSFSGTSTTSRDNFIATNDVSAYSASSSLGQQLYNGMSYGLTYSEQRVWFLAYKVPTAGASPEAVIDRKGPVEWSALTGTLSIPFFQDAGRAYNELPIRLAEEGLGLSRQQTRQTEQALLSAVAQTYWNLVGLRQQIALQREAVKFSEQLLEENRTRLEAGVINPADVTASETQLANDRRDLLSTQLDALAIEDRLRSTLDLENFPYGLRPLDAPSLQETEFRFEELLEKTYRTDPALAILQNQLATARYRLAQAQNLDKTDLKLDLSYVFNGYGKEPLAGLGEFGTTLFQGYGATLTWTVPLYDVESRETIAARRLRLAQLDNEIQAQKTSLSLQVQSVIRNLRLNRTQVATARASVALQGKLLENEISRLRLGRSTSRLVALAQQELAQANQLEILARVNFEKTYLQTLLLTNTVFDHYKLQPRRSP
ncbi:MAG: TolC family protein [Candidatus Lambdaproteobacteria bacterium]|nr:TolC family protein [Candidatus Lambdaproteobacteria bacterium]